MVFFVSFGSIKVVNVGCFERANNRQGSGCPDSGSRRVIVPRPVVGPDAAAWCHRFGPKVLGSDTAGSGSLVRTVQGHLAMFLPWWSAVPTPQGAISGSQFCAPRICLGMLRTPVTSAINVPPGQQSDSAVQPPPIKPRFPGSDPRRVAHLPTPSNPTSLSAHLSV